MSAHFGPAYDEGRERLLAVSDGPRLWEAPETEDEYDDGYSWQLTPQESADLTTQLVALQRECGQTPPARTAEVRCRQAGTDGDAPTDTALPLLSTLTDSTRACVAAIGGASSATRTMLGPVSFRPERGKPMSDPLPEKDRATLAATMFHTWTDGSSGRLQAGAELGEWIDVLADALAPTIAAMLAAERERTEAADARWNTAVDWLLNNVDANDYVAPFWAFYDGLITEAELRAESVGVEEINLRRAALNDANSEPTP